MKRLSIIIVTYNSEAEIFDCVRSIRDCSDLPLSEVEVIVVDNCSRNPDAMFDQLRQLWGNDIVLVKNTVNGGYGQGNNIGIHRSTAPVVMIMNPDVRLCEPVFRKAIEIFDSRPHVGMLGMTQSGGRSFTPTFLVNGYLRLILSAVCKRINWYVPSCMYIQGSCFFLRKDMFTRAGLFDETNFMYGEEEDIHYRMKKLYGTQCFAFSRHLHYLHLEHGQKRYLEAADANVYLYGKKGIPKEVILRHYLQSNRLLLLRARLMHSVSAIDLTNIRKNLLKRLHEE